MTSRMRYSIATRLNQIRWQLDLARNDAGILSPPGFTQLVYEAEGKLAEAMALLGVTSPLDGLPAPHRYQQRTPPPA